ncbi:MAG: hypothetical protein ACYCW6_20640, partial [Candidatus Xenobia bacterium]
PPPAPPPTTAPEPAASAPAEPPPAPSPAPEPAPAAPAHSAAAAPQPKPERPSPETEKESPRTAPPRPALVTHAFSQEGLTGLLTLGGNEGVTLLREQEPLEVESPLHGLPIGGWIDLGTLLENEPEEVALLPQVHALYRKLAELMATMTVASAAFARARSLLLPYLERFGPQLHDRLQHGDADDAICSLRFLPVVGGSLTSLAMLWREYVDLGYLPICESGEAVPTLEHAVVLTGEVVPRYVYERIFPALHTPDAVVETTQEVDTPEQKLLLALVRELQHLRDKGEFKLTDRLLQNVRWAEGSRFFIYHSRETGVTYLNATHAVWRKAIRRFARDPGVLPLLVSAVYTAINRALKDVEDADELNFLQALLNVRAT